RPCDSKRLETCSTLSRASPSARRTPASGIAAPRCSISQDGGQRPHARRLLELVDEIPDLLHGLAVQDGGRETLELPANLVRRHGIARVAARALDPLRVAGAVLAEDLHTAGPLARERRRDLLVGDDLDLAHDGAEGRRVQVS